MRTIEEVCKPKSENSKLISLTAQILVQRELKPILTIESISNADIILCQLGSLINVPQETLNYWFPTSYIYHSPKQLMWKKLISQEYCQKILPLFGVENIEDLKKAILKSNEEPVYEYNYAFKNIPRILNSIRYDEIGIMK